MNGAVIHALKTTCRYANYDALKNNIEATRKSAKLNTADKHEIDSGDEATVDRDDYGEDGKGALHKAASSVLMKICMPPEWQGQTDCAPRPGSPHLLLNGAVIGANTYTDWFATCGTHCITCKRDALHKVSRMHDKGVAYSDAEVAGCLDTQRPTTGGQICVEGRASHFPIHPLPKRQDSTASSTPEAEIVAADTVLRQLRMPSLDIWELLLQKGYKNLRGVLR